jgi:hypothetical protein
MLIRVEDGRDLAAAAAARRRRAIGGIDLETVANPMLRIRFHHHRLWCRTACR